MDDMIMGDWLYPLVGDVLIGRSATFLLAFNGRIADISGILNGALQKCGASDWA